MVASAAANTARMEELVADAGSCSVDVIPMGDDVTDADAILVVEKSTETEPTRGVVVMAVADIELDWGEIRAAINRAATAAVEDGVVGCAAELKDTSMALTSAEADRDVGAVEIVPEASAALMVAVVDSDVPNSEVDDDTSDPLMDDDDAFVGALRPTSVATSAPVTFPDVVAEGDDDATVDATNGAAEPALADGAGVNGVIVVMTRGDDAEAVAEAVVVNVVTEGPSSGARTAAVVAGDGAKVAIDATVKDDPIAAVAVSVGVARTAMGAINGGVIEVAVLIAGPNNATVVATCDKATTAETDDDSNSAPDVDRPSTYCAPVPYASEGPTTTGPGRTTTATSAYSLKAARYPVSHMPRCWACGSRC